MNEKLQIKMRHQAVVIRYLTTAYNLYEDKTYLYRLEKKFYYSGRL
jgi:hypothetical protein